jgi:hypothetical protein
VDDRRNRAKSAACRLARSMFHNLISPAIDENKEISLNGSDATTGGSFIMPIDISTEATTRSMIRTYFKGVRMRIERSSGFCGAFSPDTSMNSRRSFSRHFSP